jgi:AraC family transcriptional regulator
MVKNQNPPLPEIVAKTLFQSSIVTVRDTYCQGTCKHLSNEECTKTTQLVFPYRGVYLRHVGTEQSVAEANQVLFFNQDQGYRISHPVTGGDASLTLVIDEHQLRELAPKELIEDRAALTIHPQHLRIDARTQALVARLRHGLRENTTEALAAETLALTIARRIFGRRTIRGASMGRQKLVDRAKLVLASDLSRRWTLSDVASEVRVSPVYLTQVFQQVEGMPLYRYQLRMRLARALDLLPRCEDLTELSLQLGFSSHSHFGAAFRKAYGQTPSAFRASVLNRATAIQ